MEAVVGRRQWGRRSAIASGGWCARGGRGDWRGHARLWCKGFWQTRTMLVDGGGGGPRAGGGGDPRLPLAAGVRVGDAGDWRGHARPWCKGFWQTRTLLVGGGGGPTGSGCVDP